MAARTIVRTYEMFAVRWPRGSTWSGYHTEEAATAVAQSPGRFHEADWGTVERSTFDVEFEEGSVMHKLSQPGIAEVVR